MEDQWENYNGPCGSGPAAQSQTVVTLLDCFDLHNDSLVLERPVPCMELLDFIVTRGYILQEHLAKEITKQLVDALIEVHFKGSTQHCGVNVE
ncbi:Serine/threonine-protein kinase pim-1 [Channa argus]|uniref:Serine/threonine-protein kinase pim-1 n=1 Tax=Channa argus TaxID=215402 RepID=A0A6G1PMZ1_CHAAH|nr:Serine/threonine-protein kinase pim-1 [Channa argus]